MIQLSSRHGAGKDRFSLADALRRIEDAYQPVTRIETVATGDARSRILAGELIAEANLPAADQSAVDGYAFRQSDLMRVGSGSFRLIGVAAAGHPLAGSIGIGEAARILTGAIMPSGADTVAMQEDVTRSGDSIVIPRGLYRGDNRRLAGEDIAAGERLFEAGRRLGPAEIGVLASLGIVDVAVRAPLRVGLFSTGDELVDPGAPCESGQRYDSNRPALLALLAGMGIEATDLGILPDRRDVVETELERAALRFDAIIGSAGMSVGDEDHVRPAVEKLGALDFWDVAIKPGRPIAAGRVGETPFFGLPGNPAAAVITFLLIVRPALFRLSGTTPAPPRRFPIVADFAMKKKLGRREFLRCTLDDGRADGPFARRLVRDGSAVLSALANCDGFLELAEEVDQVKPGMTLPFIPKSEFELWGRSASS